MPIINVNAFQNGISKKNFLTSYTDAYLKQSLANLGQRNAAKGDSIGFSSFSIQDLFPNYTGDFTENNLLVQLVLYPNENRVAGYLKLLQEDGTLKGLSEVEANSKFVIDNIDHSIRGISDDYDYDNITLSDVDRINNVDYWHKDNATLYKTDNSLIYKVVGHHESGVYGAYDNEYVCEEISDDGKFIEGFRIFIINEENLMMTDNPDPSFPNSSSAHEKLALIHLHKNYNNIDSKLKNHEWVLDIYNVKENLGQDTNSEYYTGLGDVAGLLEESRIDDLIAKYADQNNTNSPSSIISNIINDIVNGSSVNQIAGILSKGYSVPVDYDTVDNASWSVPSSFTEDTWKKMNSSVSFSGTGKNQMLPDADGNIGISADIDIICGNTLEHTNGKLEYFVSDTTKLYPRLLEIYNEIMYKSDSNLKIKERIVSELVYKVWQDSLSISATPNSSALYVMYMPTNYVFNYNCNSNDESLIYNLTSSTAVQYEYINELTDSTIVSVEDNVKTLKKLVYVDGIEPTQYIFANSEIERTVLYDMNVKYSTTDTTIILSIDWIVSFIMPYINSNGYWVINGIDTNNYAKGIVTDQSSLIMISSTDINTFNANKNVLSGIGLELLQGLSSSDFEKKTFISNYIDSSVNLGGHNTFNMQAWVPSDEYLKSVSDTEAFTYFKDAIIMNMSSTELEKDSTYIVYAHYKKSSLHDKNEEVIGSKEEVTSTYMLGNYEEGKYTDWSIGSDNAYSYIYRLEKKPTSLESLIGGTGIVTSFWTCQEKKDLETNSTYYAFDYIRNPKYTTDVALDFNYICNLEQYIRYYAKYSFSPDDYEYTQLLFDPVIQLLKNNTIDKEQSLVYPVILNHKADYYNPTLGIDVTKGIGMSGDDGEQYYNSMNLAIEFDDNIGHNPNGEISYVLNSNYRRFSIGSYNVTYLTPYSYYGVYYSTDDKSYSFPKIGLVSGNLEHTVSYGVIPKVISMTNFPNEYIPNTEYNPNGAVGNQYPTVDLKEVTMRNANFWNRANLLVADNVKFNPKVSYGVIYNAYIGSAYDQTGKNVLHIGTSNTNINLGTTSMTGKDDIHRLTKMDKIQVDFDNIELNGYTMVKGEIMTTKPTWAVTKNDNYFTYTTILHPTGLLDDTQTLDSGHCPSTTSSLLSNVKFKLRKKKQTRYYTYNESRNVSYLNASKLLLDNNIPNDENTVWHGDATLLKKRTNTSLTTYINMYNTVANIAANYPGIFQAKATYYNKALDEGVLPTNVVSGEYRNELNNITNIIPTWKDWITYSLASITKLQDNVPLYILQNGKSVPLKVNTSENDEYGNPIQVQKKGTAYVLDFSDANVKNNMNPVSWYLELSTDLTDEENTLAKGKIGNSYAEQRTERLVVANPIAVSYTDVVSYQAPVETKIYTYVTAYMYATSYTEYWSCDGCELCSANDCPMIDKCNKSKVEGFFTPAYGFVIGDMNTEAYTYANEHVYTYTHIRYRKKENSKDYEKYEVTSYWPATSYLTKDDFNSDAEFDNFITKTESGIQKKLLYYPSTNEYKWVSIKDISDKSYIAKSVPIGQNIISAYNVSYISDFTKLNPNYIMKVSEADYSKICYLTEDGTTYSNLKFSYPYIEQKQTKVHIGENTYNPWITEYKIGYMDCQFSYNKMMTHVDYIDSTVRHINIREIMTSHSVPEFFNERLVKIDENDNVVVPDNPGTSGNPGTGDNKPDPGDHDTEYATTYTLQVSVNTLVANTGYEANTSILVDGVKDNNYTYLPFTVSASYKKVEKEWKVQNNEYGDLVWVVDEKATQKKLDKGNWIEDTVYDVEFTNGLAEAYEHEGNTYKLKDKIDEDNIQNYEGKAIVKYHGITREVNISINYLDKEETQYKFEVDANNQEKQSHYDIVFNYGDNNKKEVCVISYMANLKNGNVMSSERINYTITSDYTKSTYTQWFANDISDKSDYNSSYKIIHEISPRLEIQTNMNEFKETWTIQPVSGDMKNKKVTLDITRKKKS